MTPDITFLESDGRRARYRIVGVPTDTEWAESLGPGREPWCEVTLYDGEWVGSFGGEVWPGAWPDLFHHALATAQVPIRISLTEKGKHVFGEVTR